MFTENHTDIKSGELDVEVLLVARETGVFGILFEGGGITGQEVNRLRGLACNMD